MATRASTFNQGVSKNGAVFQASWTGLLNGDDGAWISFAEWSAKTFHVFGTFGAAGTVIIEGSNDVTVPPTNASTITNWQATQLSATSAGFLTARDMPIWVRPRVTGGDGTTSITVTLAGHRADIAAVG